MLIVSLMIGAVIVSVKGDATWSGHRPTTSDFTYRNAPNGPVTVHDTYGQSDATVSLAVENYRYYRNWNGNPNYDAYVLNILGSANTRVAHKWSIEKYENDWFPCPGASTTCQDAGLKNKNQGAWYNFGWTFTFYGHPYDKIFVCSNGWAAFQYYGDVNNCPSYPMPIPKSDYPGSNGVVPSAIIAPLWKDLDPTKGGSIYRYISGSFSVGGFQQEGFVWTNIWTTGSDTMCSGGACINQFGFWFDDTGRVRLGLGFVDPNDRTTSQATIGIDDPAGAFAVLPSLSSYQSNKGVTMISPAYDQSASRGYYLTDTKIVLQKSSNDNTMATFQTDQSSFYTYNIRTTNPPPPLPDSLAAQFAIDATETVTIAALCAAANIAALGCLAIDLGAIGAKDLVKALSPPPPPPELFTVSSISSPSTQSGYLEAPVQQEDILCGQGPSYTQCAVDAAVFDVVLWIVPSQDTSVHGLQIQFGAQVGNNFCCPGSATPWRWTTVTLTVDAGDFQISAGAASPSSGVTGTSATSQITVNSLNSLSSIIHFSASVIPNVPGAPIVSFSPDSIFLPSGGSASTMMMIQTTDATPAYSYSINVTGNDPYGSQVHSASTSFTVVQGPNYGLTPSPSTVSIGPGSSGSSTLYVNSINGFAGTVSLSAYTSTGIITSFSPSAVSVASGGSSSSALTLSVPASTPAGTYSVAIKGSSGSISHTSLIGIRVPVPDFSLTASPNPVTIAAGTTGTSTLSLSSLDGFDGPVSLSTSNNPAIVQFLGPSSSPAIIPQQATSYTFQAYISTTQSMTSSPGNCQSFQAVSGNGNTNCIEFIFADGSSLPTCDLPCTFGAAEWHSGNPVFPQEGCNWNWRDPTCGAQPLTTVTTGTSDQCPANRTYCYLATDVMTTNFFQISGWWIRMMVWVWDGSGNFAPTVSYARVQNLNAAWTINNQAVSPPALNLATNTLNFNYAVSWDGVGINGIILSLTNTTGPVGPGTKTICFLGSDPACSNAPSTSAIYSRSASLYFKSGGYKINATYICNGCPQSPGLVLSILITVVSTSAISVDINPASVSLSTGGSSTSTVTVSVGSLVSPGTYAFPINAVAVAPSRSHTITISVIVPTTSGGGGGGSVAHGSLITLANGTKIPVQNLKVGDVMLGYDTTTGQLTTSAVLSIESVSTSNMLIIHTQSGVPFRVDANPKQTLWVKTPDGNTQWLPVTSIQPEDYLLTPSGWTRVSHIEFASAGKHTMFDIIATMPYFTDNYLDPIFKM